MHVHDNMLCIIDIKQQDSIDLAEIRFFFVVVRFIQNFYVRQGYFTALGYYTDYSNIIVRKLPS
jgi:hypothetical protein